LAFFFVFTELLPVCRPEKSRGRAGGPIIAGDGAKGR